MPILQERGKEEDEEKKRNLHQLAGQQRGEKGTRKGVGCEYVGGTVVVASLGVRVEIDARVATQLSLRVAPDVIAKALLGVREEPQLEIDFIPDLLRESEQERRVLRVRRPAEGCSVGPAFSLAFFWERESKRW